MSTTKNWDKSQRRVYYITLCTEKFKQVFGEISVGMVLYPIGESIRALLVSFSQKNSSIVIDTYQIMPNHIHAIVVVNREPNDEALLHSVDRQFGTPEGNENLLFYKKLDKFVQNFKEKVNQLSDSIAWHRPFDVYGIADYNEWLLIAQEIGYNPLNWEDDCYFNPDFKQLHKKSILSKRDYEILLSGIKSTCRKAGKLFIKGTFVTQQMFEDLYPETTNFDDKSCTVHGMQYTEANKYHTYIRYHLSASNNYFICGCCLWQPDGKHCKSERIVNDVWVIEVDYSDSVDYCFECNFEEKEY